MTWGDVLVPHNVNVYAVLLYAAYRGSALSEGDAKLYDSYQAKILSQVIGDEDLFKRGAVARTKSAGTSPPKRGPHSVEAPTADERTRAAAQPGSKAARVERLRECFDSTKLPHTCPKCKKVTASTVDEVVTFFGMRSAPKRAEHGERSVPQPWCKACKSAANKAGGSGL